MIAIIDYNAGNTASVINALERLAQEYIVTSDLVLLEKADKIILPGVGAAKPAMECLKGKGVDRFLQNTKKPVLGICLGMQLFADFSEEGNVKCLGIIPGTVKRFGREVKVPQMGWNRVIVGTSRDVSLRLLRDIPDNSYFYFVNSYYLPVSDYTIGVTNYGVPFSSIIQKDNFYGVQFHPEKSGDVGLQLLSNFCELC
ncbi:imidazole glycerol phosphate synthase subunit HisH [Candidatus Peregrinibacteria bacterium CG_4_10_14_0_2_um_filter_43_11]|nr:MAG: imidazole glycerol phosphate synthase subunit HisH [Candidatus Peregrinibacteria bacterium CG_4_10_14_0_2_um_filter_43_11]